MKKLFIILALAIGLISCENFNKTHPDFKYTSGYFPYQFPVRTLVLGDYIYDNANDNAHKFIISVAMGGVYENKMDRVFDYEVDNTLCTKIRFSATGDTIKVLPAAYYTLSSPDKITIPPGKLNGGLTVQLTDAFFTDPLTIKNTYVVPLRLKSTNDVDSILSGVTTIPSADVRVAGQWDILPKNFTMFAVKYINEYHGNYFHKGASSVKDGTNTVLENTVYSTKYLESNTVSKMNTTLRNQVSLTATLRSAIMTGSIKMLLNFSGDNCTIAGAPGSTLTISGTGVFKAKAFTWGGKQRDGIIMTYSATNGVNTYTATDSLVIRDRAVVMELYNPVVY